MIIIWGISPTIRTHNEEQFTILCILKIEKDREFENYNFLKLYYISRMSHI